MWSALLTGLSTLSAGRASGGDSNISSMGRMTFASYVMDARDPVPGLCYSKVCEPGTRDETNAAYVVVGTIYPAYVVLGSALPANVVIPEKIEELPVRKINATAFASQTGLKSITLPSTIREIGPKAFSWCTSLTNVTILGGLELVGDQAFTNCYSLKSITFPATLRRLGRDVFVNCDSLEAITFLGNAPELDGPPPLPNNNYDAKSYLCEKRESGSAMLPRAKIYAKPTTYGWKGPYQRGLPEKWPSQYGWTTAHDVIALPSTKSGFFMTLAQKPSEQD